MTNKPNTQAHILIYTDGSCSGNPGPGGYAATLRKLDADNTQLNYKELLGYELETTNIRMEMTAVARALEYLKGNKTSSIIVRSDNQMISKAMNEWIGGWIAKGWRKADKTPVANRDLWERIVAATTGKTVVWEWIKGHAGEAFNEEVDRLAVEQTKMATRMLALR